MNHMLNTALRYLDHGLAVIPTWRSKSKNPHLDHYTEFFSRLPTHEEWRRWAYRWPQTNLAALTGYWLNYIALDFDDQETYKVWSTGVGGDGLAEQTWTVQTGRGYHVWFQSKEDPGKSRIYRRGNLEILLRARGGYCIVPPSVHHSGVNYKTIHNCLPLLVDSIEALFEGWQNRRPAQPAAAPKPVANLSGEISIANLVAPVGQPNARGAQQAYCPFHDDGKPSAWVNVAQNRFGCNACWPGLWWDAINVYAMMNGISNGEAYKRVKLTVRID